ncbi:hypothetical protein Aau02nite_86440 [Amorphoplanes auranticolor]|uniref:Glycosyltransferase subfamily 4-like N-terminal domain-containing protein n=1 Tax=Actinoplanes auranticolor TaxID=47988 RepID=A0A919SYY7_9ACTN|nr:hypothetical protein Aau02nite_86440 [Actinoplanes auranticolor]
MVLEYPYLVLGPFVLIEGQAATITAAPGAFLAGAGSPRFPVLPSPGLRAAARRILDEVQPDVVHVQSHFPLRRALVDAAHERGLFVIATNHGEGRAYPHQPGILKPHTAGWRQITDAVHRHGRRISLQPCTPVASPTPTSTETGRCWHRPRSATSLSPRTPCTRYPATRYRGKPRPPTSSA